MTKAGPNITSLKFSGKGIQYKFCSPLLPIYIHHITIEGVPMSDLQSIYEMSDAELMDFLTVYEAGEVLSSEAEIDYVMSRIPSFFSGRPVLVNYNMTDDDRDFFDRMREEAIAEGFDIDDEFGD